MPVRKRIGNILSLLLIGVVSTVLFSGCYLDLPINYPTVSGSKKVGRSLKVWTDVQREEVYTVDPTDHRSLIVNIWYPADPGPSATLGPWIDSDLADAAAVEYDLKRQWLDEVYSAAYVDAPIAESASPYPVLIMSHGDGGLINSYTYYAEELASHGYVVVGINHTFNAKLAAFPNGPVIHSVPEATVEAVYPDPETPSGMQMLWERGEFMLQIHSADQKFVLDQLQILNNSDPKWIGKLDLSKIGVLGHSFGGAASIETLRTDSRVLAAINLDGNLWSNVYQTGLAKPSMTFGVAGELSQRNLQDKRDAWQAAGWTAEEIELEIARMSSQRLFFENSPLAYYIDIVGASHLNYTDNAILAGLNPFLNFGLGTIDDFLALDITNSYMIAFFNHHLKGTTEPLLLTDPSPYPEAIFESRP